MWMRLRAATLCGALALAAPTSAGAAEAWRLGEAVGLPDRIELSITHRTRYEYLGDQFRAGREGSDEIAALRTLVHARVRVADWLRLGGEFQDSRVLGEDSNSALDTTHVNSTELLRAYAELGGPLLGGTQTLRLGRITMDVGSRRLVARNRFRNTINAFTGIDWEWTNAEGLVLRAFYTLPVRRLPTRVDRLRDDHAQFDEESFDTQFWGLFGSGSLAFGDSLELFVFGLHERDDPDRDTRNRQLVTPGFRLWREPKAGHFDYQIETALQFGESRATTGSTRDLDHFAHFHHAEVGYRFEHDWSPRLALQYDYASGDDDPSDGDNGRFDTLFGARGFDFGPTGIYGPFARANLHTPGLRLQLQPHPRLSGFAAARAFWLASDRDAWTTAGVTDPSGDSSRHVGTQIEFRVRWKPLPGNITLESGYAHLFGGDFIDEAPNSNEQGDSDYFYTQITLAF